MKKSHWRGSSQQHHQENFEVVLIQPAPAESAERTVEAKHHGESKVIQKCFDDNNDDNKR